MQGLRNAGYADAAIIGWVTHHTDEHGSEDDSLRLETKITVRSRSIAKSAVIVKNQGKHN
jgi:hypothetical protein